MFRAKTLLPLVAASLFLIGTVLGPARIASADPSLSSSQRREERKREGAGLAMVLDLALARPLGLVATVVGTGFFVAGLPFELISQEVAGPAHVLIVEPAAYTFRRPLGQFHWHGVDRTLPPPASPS